jgi:hypothetical protein
MRAQSSTVWHRPPQLDVWTAPLRVSLARDLLVQQRFHASRRRSSGHITESTPMSDTPRRMNGATVAGRSIPPANPQAATAPLLILDFFYRRAH